MRTYKFGPVTITLYSWPALEGATEDGDITLPLVRGVSVDIDIRSLHASFEVWKDTP